jgi:hypothetical protein
VERIFSFQVVVSPRPEFGSMEGGGNRSVALGVAGLEDVVPIVLGGTEAAK